MHVQFFGGRGVKMAKKVKQKRAKEADETKIQQLNVIYKFYWHRCIYLTVNSDYYIVYKSYQFLALILSYFFAIGQMHAWE